MTRYVVRDKLLLTILFSFLFGIAIRSFLPVSIFFVLIFLGGAAGALLLFAIHSKKSAFLLIPIALASFSCGIARFASVDTFPDQSLLETVGESTVLSGIVVDEPDMRANSQKLTVSIEDKNTYILVTTARYPEFHYGDTIEITGKITEPENFITDTGSEFDYTSYLSKDDIYFLMPFATVSVVSSGHGNFLKAHLFAFKRSLVDIFQVTLPEPKSTLMAGLLLGAKQSLSPEIRSDLVRTGTIHIVALSGYNVTIVAEGIMKAAHVFFATMLATWLGIATIILFVLMTGAQATAVRAGIMAILVLIARASGRDFKIERALIAAVFLMVLLSPKILIFDVSFQLSVLATLGLIYIAPYFEAKLWWIRSKTFRDLAAATLAAQIAVLPFILYKMGIFSIISLPVNLLVLPIIPLTMFLGMLILPLAALSVVLAIPVTFIAGTLLSYIVAVVHMGATLPFAAITFSHIPFIIPIVLYGLLLWWVYTLRKSAPKIERLKYEEK